MNSHDASIHHMHTVLRHRQGDENEYILCIITSSLYESKNTHRDKQSIFKNYCFPMHHRVFNSAENITLLKPPCCRGRYQPGNSQGVNIDLHPLSASYCCRARCQSSSCCSCRHSPLSLSATNSWCHSPPQCTH